MTGGTATADEAAPDRGGAAGRRRLAVRPGGDRGRAAGPAGAASSPVTRFAPAPTGDLHLGHLVNALYTWGIARATGGRVILRIEDHDRQRSRPAYEAAMLDDLERLGLAPR